MDASLLSYRNGVDTQESILEIVGSNYPKMTPLQGLDRGRFLWALAAVETSWGKNNIPRHENAYDKGGLYAMKSQNLRQELSLYGPLAACSYGPWQMLYITAKEHGFVGHPIELWKASISIEFVIRYFNEEIAAGAECLEDLADAWNSGNFKDANKPMAYILQLKDFYTHLNPFE